MLATSKAEKGRKIMRSLPAQARGLSLIELLVSITLGLILASGLVTVYIDSKNNYQAEDEIARVQENGRYALSVLKRELALSGFLGGHLDTESKVTCAGSCTGWAFDASVPVEFVNSVSASDTMPSSSTRTDFEAGTDIFSVKRTSGDFTLKDGEYGDGKTAADDNQWYLRAENYGDFQEWVFLGSGGIPSGEDVAGSEIDYWEYYVKTFYIRNYSVSAGDGVPTLCVERLIATGLQSQCLIEGIEDLQVEFGIDSDGDNAPNQFKSNPTAAEIESAVAARIYLLVRGIDAVAGYTNNKTYTLGDKDVAAKNDAFVRRVFSTTVQMRNTVLPSIK
jgi:type II secretory pathway pseudopilin PulG